MALVALIFLASCNRQSPKAELETPMDSLSYSIGLWQAQGLKQYLAIKLNVDTIMKNTMKRTALWMTILCLTFAATACSDADLAEAAEGKWINTCQLKDDEGTPYTQSTLYSFTHIDSNTKEGGCVAIHDAPSFLFITI